MTAESTNAPAGYWDDDDREEGIIASVSGPSDGGWYSVSMEGGMGCGVSAEYGVEPKVGDRFVTWGRFGFPIRGMAINGAVLFYRTPVEQDVENAKQRDEYHAKKIAEYESKRHEFDARVAALPAPLRERIESFRAFKGEAWRWDHEPYELNCCEEAVKLAEHFKTTDALVAFWKSSWEEQIAAFPPLKDSGHSGNSFGQSCNLAKWLIEKPEIVGKLHGALCPLVGCEDYGCWATRPEATAMSSEGERSHG